MLTKPLHGWTNISVDNFSERASYLTDIPNDCLDAFIYALKTNNPAVVFFDAEGYEFHLVSSYYRSYVIIDKEDNTVETYTIDKNIIKLAKELIDDIENYFEEWLNWEYYDDIKYEYAKTNRDVFKEKLSMLKFELNRRK